MRKQNETVLYRMAQRCVALDLDKVPQEVIERAKFTVVDAIDNFFEGFEVTETIQPVLNAARKSGEATLYGCKTKAEVSDAVFFNVVTGSITARNDHHAGGNVHPGCVVVPAVLAAAEAEHFDGKRVLEAVIIGYETMIRLGIALKAGKHYPISASIRTSMLPAPMGVAFALAKLYALDVEQTMAAAALACNHMCGINQWRLEGTSEDIYQNAWDAVNAMHCVRLARAGVKGAAGNLDGAYGFLTIFGAEDQGEVLLDGLGNRFLILETRSKVTGACARVLAPCQLAQEYLDDPDFQLKNLEKLTIHMNKKCTMMSWYTSRDITCQSESINSVPFGVAAVLSAGDLDRVSWFPPYSAQTMELMDKIELVYDELSQTHLDPDGYRFEAKMKNGNCICKEKLTYVPLADDKIIKRFLKTMQRYYGIDKAQELQNQILRIESLGDACQLTEQFSL